MKRGNSLTLRLAVVAVLGTAGACTVWNDLSVPDDTSTTSGHDGSTTQHTYDAPATSGDDDADAEPTDAGVTDAAKDAGPVVSFLSLEDAARACLLVEKCPNLPTSIVRSMGVPIGDTNWSACMTLLAGQLPPDRVGATAKELMTCVAGSTSCTQAGACMPLEVIDGNDSRCNGVKYDDAGDGVCGSGDLLYCDPTYLTEIFHCSNVGYATGSTCMSSTDGLTTQCGTVKGCAGAYSCSGNVYAECYGNDQTNDEVTSSRNCAVSGSTCGMATFDGGAYADCLAGGQDKTCDSTSIDGEIFCRQDAGLIEACGDFYFMDWNCAALGETCVQTGSSAYCHKATDECSPTDTTVNTCTGTVLTYCLAGKKTTIDCASIGASCMSGGSDAPSTCK